MICPHCNREDFISLARNRKLVEFRLLNTKGKSGSGEYVFRGKQWKKERDMIDSEYYLRCNACETKLDNSDLKKMGIGEIKYGGKSKVVLASNMLDKFFE